MQLTFSKNDSIAAVTTPAGEGAIAVIRACGPDVLTLLEPVFSGPLQEYASHTVHYGSILDREGKILDQVLLTVMKNPRSYTGEDTVEISCHGGRLITKRVLQRILETGIRPAQPGEFSLRAYLNGKMDLAQAEAVQQLIHAKNDLALHYAQQQLEGALSREIQSLQKELAHIAAILEAWVDFPEEGLEFAPQEELLDSIAQILRRLTHLKQTYHRGKPLQEGVSLCLLGAPNVGKSSLMNALLKKERAIVTEIPGTTRDLIEESLYLGGLHCRLIDTAGIRETEEPIEQEGIRRAQKTAQEADVTLLLLDASRPLQKEELSLLAALPPKKTLIVWNKVDLQTPSQSIEGVWISAKKGEGLASLEKALETFFWNDAPPSKEELLLTQERHYQALQRATTYLTKVEQGLREEASPEFVAFDMRSCLYELSTLIGMNVSEEILDAIFSQFCLGK